MQPVQLTQFVINLQPVATACSNWCLAPIGSICGVILVGISSGLVYDDHGIYKMTSGIYELQHINYTTHVNINSQPILAGVNPVVHC